MPDPLDDSLRRGEHDTVTFTFLEYAFRPRQVMGKNGKIFTSFTPAISPEALKAKGQMVRGWRLHMRTGTSLDELATAINPIARVAQMDMPNQATMPSSR